MTLEYASDTVEELLSMAEQLKNGYTMQINVSSYAFIRVYINTNKGCERKELANLSQQVTSTEEADLLLCAVEDALLKVGAIDIVEEDNEHNQD